MNARPFFVSGVRALVGAVALACAAVAQAAVPIEHWQMPNGAKIYLAATDALPIVDVQIDFDAGSRRDPALLTGLAGVTAGMVEKGVLARNCPPPGRPKAGTASSGSVGACLPALDENQLGEAWADLGADFGVGASSDRMSFSLRTLSEPALLERAVALAARQIGEPAFPDSVWTRERQRLIAALRESLTKPGTQAGRAFGRLVYGNHVYGAEATEATLAAIDTAAMRARYAQTVVPCRAKLSIVGAVTRARAEQIATQLLAQLPQQACPALGPVADVPLLTQSKEERIPFESAQAHVWIGQPGYPRSDPRHFALTLGNYILGGGGFVSRLTEEVREKRGLAYSVYSTFLPGLHAGAFRIGFQTRPDQAAQAVQVSREVLAKFVTDGPTDAELQAAKDNLIGGFPLLLDSNAKLLSNVANIAWNDLPLDYLDTWTARMNAVTVADVRAAMASALQPDRMVTVVVGGR
ncbi:MAG: insulinase family protein [Comamonadaceae bacterium]|nr:MAG: insulinase family protein [Comamonadaceae bacterium]